MRRQAYQLLLIALSAWLTSPLLSSAADVDYLRDIKPLLTEHCYACHGALKQESDLRLDTASSILQGGKSGSAIDLQQPLSSSILERVQSSDPAMQMPPEGKRLNARQVDLIEEWIRQGAQAPKDELPQSDPMLHWAFQAPQSVAPTDGASCHPVDRWLEKRMKATGVRPIGEATRRELVRRVTFDLIGIPPTPADVKQFLEDTSPDAYERLIERLLARPEYGERWGRHWMDVWRYSDWYGRRSVPDVMNSYPQIWRWRDWIVQSLNEDKGYDQMIVEMLAADELYPTDPERLVATGFLVRNWYKWNYETWMKDNVEHTGKAFLGLTLNCAMCHDHKYDPISQEDYFRFRAFFEPLELRHERIAGEPDPGPFQKYVYAKSYGPIQSGAIRVFDEKLDAETFMFRGGDARNRIEGRPAVSPGPPRAFTPADFSIRPVDLPLESQVPGLQAFVRTEERELLRSEHRKATQEWQEADQRQKSIEDRIHHARASATNAATDRKSATELIALEYDLLSAKQSTRVLSLALEKLTAKQSALEARIAADDARYRNLGDADALAKAAHLAEKQSNLSSAEHQRAQTELDVFAAQQSLGQVDEKQKKAAQEKLDAAIKKNQAANAAVDSARTQLFTIDAAYQPLSAHYPARSTGRRAALARWIASSSNPLTARVAMNHVWMRHFGRPLVESVENFGIQGKLPSHPELLDWLAVEFMTHDWSLKHIHRLVLTSAAYRRASHTNPSPQSAETVPSSNNPNARTSPSSPEDGVIETSEVTTVAETESSTATLSPTGSVNSSSWRDASLKIYDAVAPDGTNDLDAEQRNLLRDRDNLCYWRFPIRRMEAEVVRDSVLACANSLDRTMGGRELDTKSWTTNPRRSLYFTQHGEAQMLFLNTFDGANVCECYKRSTTILPVQALAMTNSELLVHYGRLCYQQIRHSIANESNSVASDQRLVQACFEVVLNRPPRDDELASSLAFLENQRSVLERTTSDQPPPMENGLQLPASNPADRAAENLVIALFSHNDFITIR